MCDRRFLKPSSLAVHKQEHVAELAVHHEAIGQRIMQLRHGGHGSCRGLNKRLTHRQQVLVASNLARSNGTGQQFRIESTDDAAAMQAFLAGLEGKTPFVYTNVLPAAGGEEGRAFHLSPAAVEQFVALDAVQRLLEAAAGTGIGRLGADYKIDSIDYLYQTHSSWYESHIDTHSQGSLDFAIICLLGVDNLASGGAVAKGCGVKLFPEADVHDESMNLVAGGSMGAPVTLLMERPGDAIVFPGRWVYHRTHHSDAVGITGALHKVVLFGAFLEGISVAFQPLCT